MKISCQACAAKYTIADEKVLGKIVKIRCKKCGATIVVNGNDPSANAGAAEPAPRFDYVAQGAHGDTWTVNVADGDQRTLTDGEIADAFHAGVVDDETFCWKDGMTDWLPIREIDQLTAACTATRAGAVHHSTVPPADGVTRIQDAGPGLFAASPPPAAYVPPRPMAGQPGNGAMAAPAAAAAARRTGGRAPAADLFGGAAQAGSEEDVMTSAPVGMPQAHDDDAKLTGQRNENSVLFSLNALTSKGPGPAPGGRPMTASSEASGLIDIRQLGQQIGIGDDKKKSRIDDIMNLAGGGAFSPSLSAPVMTGPSLDDYAPVPEAATATGQLQAAGGGKSRALIFGAIGAGVVVICGAIGIAAMVMGKPDKGDADKTAGSASASATAPTTSAATGAPTTTATDTSSAAPPPADTSTAATSPTTKPTTTAATTATTATAATTATTKPTTTTTAATTAPTTTAAPTATAAAGGADQPFNMGEAKARLASIAGSVQGCKKGDASGSGRVVVTFAPGGNVSSAVVSGPPFEGTPTGACIASRFRGAHVPAFTGSPFSVSKSFTIN